MARQNTPMLKKTTFFGLSLPAAVGASLLLLLLFACASIDANQTAVMALAVLTGGLTIFALTKKQLGGLCTLCTASLLLYMVVFGLSTFSATSGKFAMDEYSKLLVAFFAYILVVLFITSDPQRREKRMNTLLLALSVVSAVVGIVSISSGFGDLFATVLSPITQAFTQTGGVETGVRITSILGNPNIYGGLMGLGIFATLALLVGSTSITERRISLFLLTLNSIAFMLAFSMGATGAIAAGFILLLVLIPKKQRGALFASMLLTLVLTLVGIAVAFPLLETSAGLISLAVALGCAALAPVFDHYAVRPVLCYCDNHRRMVTGGLIALVALCASFVFFALTLTGSIDLNAGETLRRSAYPTAGDYTLVVDASAPVSVTIESQNNQEAIIHSSTILYTGPAEDAVFTVPEGSLVTYFHFSSAAPVTIDRATWSDGTTAEELPLKYQLLPGFISNRLQGLKANENAIQRTAFFEDGLKLFALHPITGNGLGGFENGVMQVQDFFYETKYVHNHFIQTLCDAGAPGLVAFLALLATAGLSLIKGRKNEKTASVSAVLLGGLLFMMIHASAEVIFSDGYYLLFAFLFFALANIQTVPRKHNEPTHRAIPMAATGVVVVLCGVFGSLWFLSAQGVSASQAQQGDFFTSMEKSAKLDYYNRNDYYLSYVMNSIDESAEIVTQADEYAEYLSTVPSNSIGRYLVGYYLQRQEIDKAFEVALSSISYVKSNPSAWNELFAVLNTYTTEEIYQTDSRGYQAGLATLRNYLKQVQAVQLDTITLNATSLEYLENMDSLATLGGDSAGDLLNGIFDLSEALTATGGTLPNAFHMTFKQAHATADSVTFEQGAMAKLILDIPADVPLMLFVYIEGSNVDDMKVSDQFGNLIKAVPHKNGYLYNAFVASTELPVVTFDVSDSVTITNMTVTR